jgi:hypothetical protein
METRFGQVTAAYTVRGVRTYRAEEFHDGLHKYALMRANDIETLRNELQTQALQWNATWKKQCETDARLQRTYEAKEARRIRVESWKAVSLERTREARVLLETLRTLLASGIEIDPTLDLGRAQGNRAVCRKYPSEA